MCFLPVYGAKHSTRKRLTKKADEDLPSLTEEKLMTWHLQLNEIILTGRD